MRLATIGVHRFPELVGTTRLGRGSSHASWEEHRAEELESSKSGGRPQISGFEVRTLSEVIEVIENWVASTLLQLCVFD
jgi:hypothetical protein